MHMQERVDSDVGRQSWEQSPLLTLQGLVPSWSGEVGGTEKERIEVALLGTCVRLALPGDRTVTAFTLDLVGVTTQPPPRSFVPAEAPGSCDQGGCQHIWLPL